MTTELTPDAAVAAPATPIISTTLEPVTQMPTKFVVDEVPPAAPGSDSETPEHPSAAPPLGKLAKFAHGNFTGRGFNSIFRPHFPGTPTGLAHDQPDSDNVLQLSPTIESLSFSKPIGSIPNRGAVQDDIFLNGVQYTQTVSDTSDPAKPVPIHVEPGLWVAVPATTEPAEGITYTRMASIPHGTTIEAQSTAAFTVAGGPTIAPVDMTPFQIGNPAAKITFDSQTAANSDTARIPQDLSTTPSIAQALIDNPNQLLIDHIAGQNIISTDVIEIDTKATSPLFGGGTDNIAFLVGNGSGPNANAVEMTAIFWIETVSADLVIPPWTSYDPPLTLYPEVPAGRTAPTFIVTPTHDVTVPETISVTYTQIQYTQNVSLNFRGLTWPHISVATLVPAHPIVISA